MVRLSMGTTLGVALVAIGGAAAAQTRSDVTVTTTRMPQAEAPKSATCEAIASDPMFRAQLQAAAGNPLMARLPYLPTRLPRNPDYRAPPLVPVGAPLPTLTKSRFGVSEPVYATAPGTGIAESAESIDGATGRDASPTTATAQEQTIDLCRALYAGPGGVRSAIARNDETLPMALALFDQRRFAEALPWFEKAARKLPDRDGGDEAQLYIAKLALHGFGDRAKPGEAVKKLRTVAELRFNPVLETPIFDPDSPDRTTAIGEAAILLANIYRTGFGGTPRDMAQACKWYERAYDVGHLAAAKTLGDIYLAGDGVPADPARAVRYYRKAADYGLPAAQVALARLIDTGQAGLKRDPAMALDLYRAAARHRNGHALFAVARAYDLGQGVAADPQRALSLYKAAALTGLPEAKVAMGTYFHEGTLVAKDEATARKWFESAAKDRDVDGMFNLAALMANGSGGPRDLSGALTWLKRAAAGGHQQAPAAIAKVEAMMGNKG